MQCFVNYVFLGCLLVLVGCVAPMGSIPLSGTTNTFRTVEKAIGELTPRQEYYLGRSIAANVLTESPAEKSEALQLYLNQLGQYLALHSTRPEVFGGYKFVATNTTMPFAMSAPGGFVFVSLGMVNLVRNEDELAALLAHEISHIAFRHAEENIQSSNRLKLGEGFLSALAIANPTLAQLTSFVKIVSDSVNMKFNQEQELEADAEAFRILYRAGYSPDALMKVIKRIPEDSSAQLSHPSSDARIYELIQLGRGVKRPFNKKTLARFLLVAPSKSQKKLSPKPVQKKKSRKKL